MLIGKILALLLSSLDFYCYFYQRTINKIMYQILSTCKGGGYMYCRTSPVHPKANSKGLYPLHRVLVENKLGRSLLPWEDVHHLDEDKTNNYPDNLKALSKSQHAKDHIKPIETIKIKCSCCGKNFELKPHQYRMRKKRNKSNQVYCSRSCATKMTYRR